MVSTRHHPSDFSSPPTPPTKSPSPRSTASPSPPSKRSLATSPSSSTSTSHPNAPSSSSFSSGLPPTSPRSQPWTHTPSHLTTIWLLVSLPLVLWDTAYVLLRPHSMPGGALHGPVWTPYKLYGEVDYIYGWPAWEGRNGFTAAQAVLNLLETAAYAWYLVVVLRNGRGTGGERVEGRGAPNIGLVGWWGEARVVTGKGVPEAVLLAFAASVMTVSKTVLYWLNEYFSGFENIGHNSPMALLVLWIIPNGAWLVFPSYMIYVFGQEILQGLAVAGGNSKQGKGQ